MGSYITFFTVYGDITVRASPRGSTIIAQHVVEPIGSKHDTSFVFFCLFGVINSVYAILWVSFGFSVDKQWLTIVC